MLFLELIRHMLHCWIPEERPMARDLLNHAYFGMMRRPYEEAA